MIKTTEKLHVHLLLQKDDCIREAFMLKADYKL